MQRVLIIENQLLLGAGIQSLLAGQVDLDVVGISPDDQARFIQEISQLRPDIIVLDETSRLACPAILLTLLKEMSKLRILVISADHNLVHIYEKQAARLYGAPDLFEIIRKKSFSDQTL